MAKKLMTIKLKNYDEEMDCTFNEQRALYKQKKGIAKKYDE